MRILLIFTLLSFITGRVGSFTVMGYSGGTVIINCHYRKEDSGDLKYFCMNADIWSCKVKIITGVKDSWYHSDRFSLYDDTEVNNFMVVIRNLTRQDEGTYCCRVDKLIVPDSCIKIQLKVMQDECSKKSFTETAYLGGDASIICNYPEERENNTKYFCKENHYYKTFDYKVSSYYNLTTEAAGRFSVTDDRTERRYTVTISNLTEDDTGTYWCGVGFNTTEHRYVTLITPVHLHVIRTTTITATPKIAPPRTPFTLTTTIAPPATPSNSASPSPSLSTWTLNKLGTTVIILVYFSVVVLLLVIILNLVYRRKYNKTTAAHSSHRATIHTGTNGEGCHGDGDYEEIKEHPLMPESGRATVTIYTTANLPQTSSDFLHYTSHNFKNDPGCPMEDPHSEEGSLPSGDSATISKEDISSSDYAIVNVGQNFTYSTVNHPHSSSEAPPL
ncbi:hypothetical protein UPYG_G00054470 [Umbra pygmaea]|uniref:Immunoglobulin domain-containing protein n=1 Tax=Umbra pygmaea TaxID=75934 RepID=A0ABD0XSX3_UMBPY